ncbi:hypothetical protein [Streptomyces alfalfae]|uniref:hypothetical protein n=1 Tax=Streptomyces alfalfae TaxID=1642299 RepID=UPI00281281BD|nr:hypothetical protein [Streptomyces alfalfae]
MRIIHAPLRRVLNLLLPGTGRRRAGAASPLPCPHAATCALAGERARPRPHRGPLATGGRA